MKNLSEKAVKNFKLNGKSYRYYDINSLEQDGYNIKNMPYSIKVMLESVLRQCDGLAINEEHVKSIAAWSNDGNKGEVPFKPARVILQDFTGVPSVVDLAAMRSAFKEINQDENGKVDSQLLDRINPEVPVDLVIDHSIQVDAYGKDSAIDENVEKEFQRNNERYQFLNWAQKAFDNFSVVPPSTGIVHQVNLEYLAHVVITKEVDGDLLVYPDTLMGTDSHTTMINGLGVLGWGVGGIEAEAAMLGQPSYSPIPEVVGVKLTGSLPKGTNATDLALVITQLLRQKGVVGKFVEYYGPGIKNLTLADRATIANMAPEYGATCGFFPVDEESLNYLKLTGRSKEQVELIREYLTRNSLFYKEGDSDPQYTDVIELDLSTVESSLAGPKRPQDRVYLGDMKQEFLQSVTNPSGNSGHGLTDDEFSKEVNVKLADGRESTMRTGSIAIASITSCTNTSNPSVMLGAGIIAKKAVEKGLKVPAHVKTSLAPGSKVVKGYLDAAGLQPYLDKLGFQIIGYGCATCIGNSGPLPDEVSAAITGNDLLVTSVLSGNRNFEGRIHSQVKANYLASPPLVVAYAIAGTVDIDLTTESLGKDMEGNDVYLSDIWPNNEEINEAIEKFVQPDLFKKEYKTVYDDNPLWNDIESADNKLYNFEPKSTYIQNPPFFDGLSKETEDIKSLEGLSVIAKFGDSITTDHISPAGAIAKDSPAGKYLTDHGVSTKDFNTYGSRRGNHEVMMRGTFANIRIRNQVAAGTEGGYTTYWPTKEVMPIYDACMKYKENDRGLVVLAGKDYGMGSSRDWAAKGPNLLGIKAVIAESYERIHRSNLVMMGILPLEFLGGETADSLGLTGEESLDIDIVDSVKPRDTVKVRATSPEGKVKEFDVLVRFDSAVDVDYYRHGGILSMVLRNKMS